jgi:hypothetical protein
MVNSGLSVAEEAGRATLRFLQVAERKRDKSLKFLRIARAAAPAGTGASAMISFK